MEKYFKADQDSEIFRIMEKYSGAMFKLQQFIKQLYDKYELDGNNFLPMNDTFAVQGTENNMKYKQHFRKDTVEGLYVFKLNTEFAKEWKKIYEDNNLIESNRHNFHSKVLNLFKIPLIFGFELLPYYDRPNRILYFKFSSNKDFVVPDDIQEIKASEFYSFVESLKN